jgi:hypothetical protein
VKPAQHRVCGGIFTPDPAVPPDHNGLQACRCSLVGRPGDPHHTVPEVTGQDGRQLAAGERGEG